MRKSLVFGVLFLSAGVLATAVPTAASAATATTTATTAQKVTIQSKSGKLYLGFNDGIAVYKNPELTQLDHDYATLPAATMPDGTPGVAYDQIAVDASGKITAYHFAGQGWASARGPFYTSNPFTFTIKNENGVAVVGAKAATIYTDAALTKSTGRNVRAGSSWQYFSYRQQLQGQIGGAYSYNLGGNQWISANGLKIYPNSSRDNNNTFIVNYPAHPTWSVAKYQLVNGTMKPIGLLPAKSQWKTFRDQVVGGKVYHNLGGNQWVLASTGTLKNNY